MLFGVISYKTLVVCSDVPEDVEIVGKGHNYLLLLKRENDLLNVLPKAFGEANIAFLTSHHVESCSSECNRRVVGKEGRDFYIRSSARIYDKQFEERTRNINSAHAHVDLFIV